MGKSVATEGRNIEPAKTPSGNVATDGLRERRLVTYSIAHAVLPPSLAPSFGLPTSSAANKPEQGAGAGGAAEVPSPPPHDAMCAVATFTGAGTDESLSCRECGSKTHPARPGESSAALITRGALQKPCKPSSEHWTDEEGMRCRRGSSCWGRLKKMQPRRVSWRPIAVEGFQGPGFQPVSVSRGAPLTLCPSAPLDLHLPRCSAAVPRHCETPWTRRPNFLAQLSARARPTLLPPLSIPLPESERARTEAACSSSSTAVKHAARASPVPRRKKREQKRRTTNQPLPEAET